MYSKYKKKNKVSKVKTYFDSRIKEKEIKTVYTTAFDKITKGRTSIGKYDNYKITKIIDNKNIDHIVYDNELVRLNFGYSLTWKWIYLNTSSAVKMDMNRYSSVVLKYDGKSFKIYDIIDKGLFNYANQYTRDF